MTDEERRLFARCLRRGDRRVHRGRYAEARLAYQDAWEALPEPREHSEHACAVQGLLGDVAFFEGNYQTALRTYGGALRLPGGADNPYLHLRLGESLLELGDERNAALALARAYEAGGDLIFSDEDPRYLNFLRHQSEQAT